VTGNEPLVLNLLVLAVSGLTSVLVGLVFRRLADVGRDVKEIRAEVGKHESALARGEARIEQLRSDVDGLLARERERAGLRAARE
jgi:hypothetical protein